MAYDIPRGKLTTLEEDFKEIGLLSEGEPPGKDKELAKPGVSKTKKLVPGKGDGDDETDLKKEGSEDGEFMLTLEARVARLKSKSAGGRKKAKKSKRYYKQHKGLLKRLAKKRAHSSHGKRVRLKHQKVLSRMGGTKKGKRIYTMGLDRISNMIEDVQDIVTGVVAKDFTETVKGYANMAIIAEQLAGIFASVSEEAESRRLARACEEMAELCAGLAEEAAEAAEALDNIRKDRDELRGLDRSQVESHFRDQMSCLLDGLEFYDNLIEDGGESEHGDRDNDLETDGAGAEGEHGDEAEEDDEHDDEDEKDHGDEAEEDDEHDDDDEDPRKAKSDAEEDDEHDDADDDEDEDEPKAKKESMKVKKAKAYSPPWKR